MRVLVVLSSTARRGAEVEGEQLTRRLRAAGVGADVVALAPGTSSASPDVPTLGTSRRGLRTLHALRSTARSYDVVVAYGSSTLPACAIGLLGARRPFVYRSIGDPGQWLRGRAHRLRTRVLMRRAAAVVALWDGAAASIVRLYGLPPDRVVVVPNGRDPQALRPPTADDRSAARAHFGVADGEVLAAVVASLSPEKRVDLAVRAIAETAGTRLLVVGDGPLRGELQAVASALLAERATFAGALDDVLAVYHAADLLLLTSRTEGMPGVLVEAAMTGLRVVACDVGAVRWMAERGMRGSIVPVTAEPEAIAAAIAETGSHGRGAPALVDVCGWDQVVPQWVACLERVAAQVMPDSSSAVR